MTAQPFNVEKKRLERLYFWLHFWYDDVQRVQDIVEILEEMPPYIRRLPEYGEHYGIIEQCEQELNEAVCKCEQEWVAAVQEGIVHEEWCACRRDGCYVDCSARRV